MRKVLFVICLSVVAALVAAGPAAAGKPYADIKATAVCSPDKESGNKILNVDVGYVFTSTNQTLPIITLEKVTLEKHVANLNNKWTEIADLYNKGLGGVSDPVDVSVQLCDKQLLSTSADDPPGTVDPAAGFNFFGDFSDANALRAVVVLTLDNANPSGKNTGTFYARCVSFQPPVCTP